MTRLGAWTQRLPSDAPASPRSDADLKANIVREVRACPAQFADAVPGHGGGGLYPPPEWRGGLFELIVDWGGEDPTEAE